MKILGFSLILDSRHRQIPARRSIVLHQLKRKAETLIRAFKL